MLFRKVGKFKLPSLNTFRVIAKKTTEGGSTLRERTKCLIFDYEMCTLQKVGGEDSKGRRVL